ncbi:MAG: hypothetical protein NTZ33_15425 [Bacteroidetes bacterium]|nr:hypothetical protein [Bacteroidota bacterium]
MGNLKETAKEFGIDYLGAFDAVHFSINPVKGGYYEKKGADIETNAQYYKDNKDNIPFYNPNESTKKEDYLIDLNKYQYNDAAKDNTDLKPPLVKEQPIVKK